MTSGQTLSTLALRRLRTPAGEGSALAGPVNGEGGANYPRVLRKANERAWLVLELMLAGEPLVERAQREAPDFGQRLGEAMKPLLEQVAPEELRRADKDWRQSCWQQLRAARDAGLLAAIPAGGRDYTNGHGASAGLGGEREEPAERQVLDRLADECERSSWYCLRPLLEMRAWQGDPFVVVLLAWFIRQALGPQYRTGETHPLDLYEWNEVLLDLNELCEEHSVELEDLLREACAAAASPLPRPAADPMAASVRFQRGLACMQTGDYERAIPELSSAIQHNPGMAVAYAQRGDAHRLMGSYDQALADYSAALRVNSSNLLVLINRGQTYRILRRPDRAIADYDAALQLDPSSVVALNHRGNAHADLGDHEAAIADFTLALQADPNYPFTYQNRAQAHAARGDLDSAISDYGQVLRLNPMFTLAYVRRADCYRQKGDAERAIADYTEALGLDPLHLHAYVNRGTAYRERGQPRRALADFEAALRLDAANPQLYLHRAITYRDNGFPERALADFEAALRLDSTDPDIYYHRALTYQEKGDSQRALADLDEALRLAPESAAAWFQRGALRVTRREAEEALADLNEALRLDPEQSLVYLSRALAWSLNEQFDEVIADCTRALDLDENLIRAYTTRGTAYFRQGRHAEAIADFNRALEINPKNAETLIDRGIVHARSGNQAEALIDFTRALKVEPNNARAYASRGNIYRSQEKHEEALNDCTQAVLRDPRYGAVYSTQRAAVHALRGEYDLALADCTLSLLLEPGNRRALLLREQALEARRREGPRRRKKKPTEQPPAPAAEPEQSKPATQEMTAAQTSLHIPVGTQEAPAVEQESGLTDEPTETTIPLKEDDSAKDLSGTEMPPVPTDEPPTDDAGFEVDQTAVGLAPEQPQQTDEIDWSGVEDSTQEQTAAASAPTSPWLPAPEPSAPTPDPTEEEDPVDAALRRRDEEATRKRMRDEYLRRQVEDEKKKKQKQKKAGIEDPGEAAERWQRRKAYAAVGVLVLMLGYYGWDSVVPPLYRYFFTQKALRISAEKLAAEFARDPKAAERKYAARSTIVTGILVKIGQVPGDRNSFRYSFQLPGNLEKTAPIELVLGKPDDADEVQSGESWGIIGVVQPLKTGSGLEIKPAAQWGKVRAGGS